MRGITMTCSFPPDLLDRIKNTAEQMNVSAAHLVRCAVTKYLGTKEKELRASDGSQKISSA
mgnify:CR=1 FL=1